jgi:hypothetical protein
MLYLWGLPIVALAQLQRAHREVLGGGDFDLGAYVGYDDKLGILTPNTLTPYYMGFADLSRAEIVQLARNAFAASWLARGEKERYLDALESYAAAAAWLTRS